MRVTAFDIEYDTSARKITEYGYWSSDGSHDRSSRAQSMTAALNQSDVILGHNILHHDLPILQKKLGYQPACTEVIDTLYLSSLLFAEKPYHKLNKPYLLRTTLDVKPNPALDSKAVLTKMLPSLLQKWAETSPELQSFYYHVLKDVRGFSGFFRILEFVPEYTLKKALKSLSYNMVCQHASLKKMARTYPLELACAMAIIHAETDESTLPVWLVHTHKHIVAIIRKLRYTNCRKPNCGYCKTHLSAIAGLKSYFGFPGFRKFSESEEVPLQQEIVESGIDRKSFIAVLPTGGGKSLCYQVPALMAHKLRKSLTVVISPLQSLMKDQVDNLCRKGIYSAHTINGLIDPITKQQAAHATEDGRASVIYLSPESLRSSTIFRILAKRDIERFVIDEAHCFSSWGHDFRTDYLYIAKFIQRMQDHQPWNTSIPVSCYTATAKPEVLRDISNYFKNRLDLRLDAYTTSAGRTNLEFGVIEAEQDEKFKQLVELLTHNAGPTIIYVSRVKRCDELAEQLRRYHFDALVYHGKLESDIKTKNQELFMSSDSGYDIMIATSAFGMGVDKDDIANVIHYEISSSLENYVQESGRAGRDPSITAKCQVLYHEDDLQKHFALLNSTKLNKKDIDQVWRALKNYKRKRFSKSALEIAERAGWDTNMRDLQTRVKTALAALEEEGFILREENATRLFAKSVLVKNFDEAREVITSKLGNPGEDKIQTPIRIMNSLMSRENTQTDRIAMDLSLDKFEVGKWINQFKDWGLLGDSLELDARVSILQSKNGGENKLKAIIAIENLLFAHFNHTSSNNFLLHYKQLHSEIGIDEPDARTYQYLKKLLFSWNSSKKVKIEHINDSSHSIRLHFLPDIDEAIKYLQKKQHLASTILTSVLKHFKLNSDNGGEEDNEDQDNTKVAKLRFNLAQLRKMVDSINGELPTTTEVEEALFYLIQNGVIEVDKGLMVFYNPMKITRVAETATQYTNANHERLGQFYTRKIEQIHIVGEYAQKMLRSHIEALTFVNDYFHQDYDTFLKKYFFKRKGIIKRPVTEKKFRELTVELSEQQTLVIKDNKSPRILVGAGPGSGKTRVLVHKVASILLMEDVKSDQFLMLTFSRQAAEEMRSRLHKLIGSSVYGVDIKTFHSYAFQLTGLKGDLDHSGSIIKEATAELRDEGPLFPQVSMKQVIVVDEFQDVDTAQFDFLKAIVDLTTDARVVVVGDDDQNIYEFRGSSVKFMREFASSPHCTSYFLTTNFRSKLNLVRFTNAFLKTIPGDRLKTGIELIPHDQRKGELVINHFPPNTIPALHLVKAIHTNPRTREIAILTRNNEEALQITSLLDEMQIPVNLILDRSGYKVSQTLEFKVFSYLLKEKAQKGTGYIVVEDWNKCLKKVQNIYRDSNVIKEIVQGINLFSSAREHCYLVDWQEYLRSLSEADLIINDIERVWVSTMHKSKGKEFDSVYLYLDNLQVKKPEEYRLLYVALTRARQNLHVYTNTSELNSLVGIHGDWIEHDDPQYELNKIQLQFDLRHINLGRMKGKAIQQSMRLVTSGAEISLSASYNSAMLPDGQKLPLSNRAKDIINKWKAKGYVHELTIIDRIVVWRAKDDAPNKNYRVPILRVHLNKESGVD